MLADSKKLVISQGERKWIPFSRAMELGIPAPVRNLLNLNFIHK
jgi:protein involved in temperature-dependent protein secretion